MNKLFYPKLAWQNLRNNAKFYFPYILTVVFSAASFYIMLSLNGNADNLPERVRYAYLSEFVAIGIFVVALFSIIFLFYTNSFLMKKRNKEIALYNILGMGKRHIAKVLAFESLYTAVFGIGGGIVVGFVFQKLVAMLLYRLMRFDVYYDFYIFGFGIGVTAVIFGLILFVNLIFNLLRIHLAKPIELLHSGSAGEKEPKTKWFLTVIGIAALGAGYYIAVTTQNAIDALSLYFIAVFLVIIGTYCLFTSISIFVLKLLRKNKKLYYKTNNFISISGMLYRMKRNAVGLANICVLSTMVLVMVSGTLSLFLGTEDALNTLYPNDIEVIIRYEPSADNAFDTDELDRKVMSAVAEQGFEYENFISQKSLSASFGKVSDSEFTADRSKFGEVTTSYVFFTVITAEQYAKTNNVDIPNLAEDEILVYSRDGNLGDTVSLDFHTDNNPNGEKKVFKIAKVLSENPLNDGEAAISILESYQIVVADDAVFNELFTDQKNAYNDYSSAVIYSMYFDVDAPSEEEIDLCTKLSNVLDASSYTVYDEDSGSTHTYKDENISESDSNFGILDYYVESKTEVSSEYYSLNGAFFFLGVFLGILFIMATVLIIYYKQISEGYEDRERYVIMQKVGMDKSDVKRSINSQILTVFFMPLIVAVIHIAFNFKLVTLLLSLFGLVNTALTFWCTACTVGAFIVVYGIVYMLTARAYYRIVS